MGTSLSTILDPAHQLRDLLLAPRLIYFCAFFVYEGFRNGVTLTHAGMGKGAIARVYAVFFLLVGLGNLWLLPSQLKKFLSIDPATFKESLLFAIHIPPLGFIYIGLSVFMLLFAEWFIRYRQRKRSRRSRKIYRIQAARKFIYWMAAIPFALGIQVLLGLPEWVEVGIFVFFMYFSPFTSPQELKRIMIVTDEKHSDAKTISPAENVG